MPASKRPTITAHCIVKNEEIYIKQVIKSILPYVDKIILFDTGSSDATVKLINEIIKKDPNSKKITFQEKGVITPPQHTKLRQEMLEMTKTEWSFIVDGDEVWPEDQISYLVNEELINAEKLNKYCMVVGYHLAAVDLHHYTEAGHYGTPWGLHGHFALRLFKNTDGVQWLGDYNKDTLIYQSGLPIFTQANTYISSSFYWHLSKLPRSSADHKVFFRKKESKISMLPKSLQKYLYRRYIGKVPKVLSDKSNS